MTNFGLISLKVTPTRINIKKAEVIRKKGLSQVYIQNNIKVNIEKNFVQNFISGVVDKNYEKLV